MKKCKICSSNTTLIKNHKTGKDYYRCNECDYIFLDEQFYIDEAHERLHYDKHDNNFSCHGYVEMFETLIDEFVPLKEIEDALDFGCGEGEVLPILLEKNRVKCDRYDLFYFPQKVYKEKNYDLIVSTEVVEHLENPLEVLQELSSHLREDAYLLLMTRIHPQNDEEFLEWFYIRDVTHIGFFSLKTFEYLGKKLSLEIVKHNSKNTILFKKSTRN
ncbi:MAG: class I SAM-dependent methyltransferase [Sulfurimonas sp.]|uniref:class I SAM-dependent methyltransferase n=1 Tax=Sulfurimonas sp. TaxID=2022749 RepID=UPI0025DE1B65|nr:class I SAM-dependent methyltransferase [Sulfurimonas sp.]MCK9490936.1 class I SAM-dependent methyltransferase [Sulfurimonas sp.]